MDRGQKLRATRRDFSQREVSAQGGKDVISASSVHQQLRASTIQEDIVLHTKQHRGKSKRQIFELKRKQPSVVLEVVDQDNIFRIPIRADDDPYQLAKKAASLFNLEFSKVGKLSELIINSQSRLECSQ